MIFTTKHQIHSVAGILFPYHFHWRLPTKQTSSSQFGSNGGASVNSFLKHLGKKPCSLLYSQVKSCSYTFLGNCYPIHIGYKLCKMLYISQKYVLCLAFACLLFFCIKLSSLLFRNMTKVFRLWQHVSSQLRANLKYKTDLSIHQFIFLSCSCVWPCTSLQHLLCLTSAAYFWNTCVADEMPSKRLRNLYLSKCVHLPEILVGI